MDKINNECRINSQIKDIDNMVKDCYFCIKECVLNCLDYSMEEKEKIITYIINRHNGNSDT